MKELSVVITVLNERENIAPLIASLIVALEGLNYEIIFVDDGSSDGTLKEIIANSFDRVKVIELRKNYGQSTAMTAGIDYSTGRYIALLDGDMQNDPADIPILLRKLKDEDWDVVAGERVNRKDGVLFRKIPSKIANVIIRRLTRVYIHDYGCTLKIFKQEVAHELGLYGDLHRFIPVLAAMQGAKIAQVPVTHHPRLSGKSKYGIDRTFKVISDLIFMVFLRRYIQKPMHLFGGIGFIALSLGILINVYLLFLKLSGHEIWGKPLLIVGMMFLLAGIQVITVGILAEINIRTYFESQKKKTYHVRKVYVDGEEVFEESPVNVENNSRV